MPANSSIDLTNLDFDTYKQSFKVFLQSQEIFRDYDLEASNINILLELLAYNSFKNGFLVNMLMAEAFLDTAQLRNSILSHAKELNYLPRSPRSAIARVRVSFTATSENAPYVIEKGKPFTTIVRSRSFAFTTPETIICTSTNTSFSFITDIYEGTYVQDSYNFPSNQETPSFKITNRNIDTRSLAVSVFEDNSEVAQNYQLSSTLLDVSHNSRVFFLQPSEDGSYEVLFGDGNIGKRPKDNAIIRLDYRVSSGNLANGAKRFSCDFDPTSRAELTSPITVDVLEAARDGSEEESIESIRYYAPRHFQVQERAITALDYEISLKTEFPEINAIHAYGGEELEPPQYGRVIIAIDIRDVNGLPDSKRNEYYRFLKRRSPFTIEPIFIEPEFSYISISTLVRYNVNITPLTSESIRALVREAIDKYREDYLDQFGAIMRQSKLSNLIDNADTSIISSITNVSVYKKLNPVLGVRQNLELDFNMPLRDDVPTKERLHKATDVRTVYSSVFRNNDEQCLFEDDGNGAMRLMKIKGDNYEMIQEVGTVNYQLGTIVINNVIIEEYFDDALKIYVRPNDPDILGTRNTIISLESDEVNIRTEELRE